MIVAVEGVIEYKEPTFLHVNVNGLTYEVFVSLQTFGSINTQNVKLHVKHIIREDAQQLYGFYEKSEKILFERLIKISGVGPKVGLAICSTFSASQFASVIASSDIAMLKKVPGIGPKSAGRILVELSGFDAVLADSNSNANPAAAEAMLALESLGFKKDIISSTLAACESTDTSSLVREALKKLQKL
ncbi:MAG: Holliday junction branch migration protein RuvA [Campylobacterota bacterium]|nr:Holliday junction branch migration protein RuvA [Campylobacterota bacterium]